MKIVLLIILFLAIPLIPFLFFGETMEGGIEQWIRSQESRSVVAAGVVVLLTVDVLLPVPSSIVCTVAGSSLGPFWGTLVSTLGMTLGALAGFGIGKFFGRIALQRWVDAEERRRLDRLVSRYGISILFLLRPVPLFAEGSLLFLGCSSMNWTVFLLATLPIHFCLALLYALLGHYVSLPLATLLSVGIAMSFSAIAFVLTRRTTFDG